MGLKGRVMELLRVGDEQALDALVADEPRAIRFLVGRLWDPDAEMRRRSARTIGVAAASHPKIGLEITRRMMWALNDESATNGLYGIPALAEIGFHSPELISPFVAPLASLVWDDGLRLEIIRALGRLAEAHPELVRPVLPHVVDSVDAEDPAEQDALARLLEESGGFDEA
jgi:hypothetical protein